jgi:predicted N-acetyltransferase YhbS
VTSGPGTPFAIPGPGPFPVRIRLETPDDEPGVRFVNLAAFTGPEEEAIVDRIRREAPDGWHSLVAVGAPETAADGIVVGHLLLSPCRVEDAGAATVATVLAIGPVAVQPGSSRGASGPR